MTESEYLDALQAAARAGDPKAVAFLNNYAAGLTKVPSLPPKADADVRHGAQVA